MYDNSPAIFCSKGFFFFPFLYEQNKPDMKEKIKKRLLSSSSNKKTYMLTTYNENKIQPSDV